MHFDLASFFMGLVVGVVGMLLVAFVQTKGDR